MKNRFSLKFTEDEIVEANVLGIPIQLSGGDRIKIHDNVFDSFPEI